MDGDISLLAIYDRVASVDVKVESLMARVDVQLAHGQRKMDALELEVDALKDRVPEKLADRLTSLESDRDKGKGGSGTRTAIIGALLSFTGGSSGGALILWLLTRHS